MATDPASPSSACSAPPQINVRSPYVVPDRPPRALLARWSEARLRTLIARCTRTDVDPEDLFTELAFGARLAQEVIAGRWCAVAMLLKTGAVNSWTQIATATGLSEAQARHEFDGWITGQAALRARTGTIGITDTEARELRDLAVAVAW